MPLFYSKNPSGVRFSEDFSPTAEIEKFFYNEFDCENLSRFYYNEFDC